MKKPAKPQPRTSTTLRLSDEERAAFAETARRLGLMTQTWMRMILREAAGLAGKGGVGC